MTKIKLSEPVLKAEVEIDTYHLDHPFIKIKKTEALWYLLCATEELMQKKSIALGDDFYLSNQYADEMKYVLKYCMQWINQSSPSGGKIPTKTDQKLKNQAIEFLNIGKEYQIFVIQYTLALDGFTIINVENHSLVVDYPPNSNPSIDAYNMLIIPELENEPMDSTASSDEMFEAITRNLRIEDGIIKYSIKPRDVIKVVNYFKVYLEQAFELPPDWRFTRYSLFEFKEVYFALISLAQYHSLAYYYSLKSAGPHVVFINNIFKFTMPGMINRLARYTTDLKKNTIKHIINDLTYGAHGLTNPDPALQPIIQITDEYFVFVPTIVITNSPERNLISLLNRIPQENKIYSRISNQKESMMKEKIKSELKDKEFRYWSGKISKSGKQPDIDLAIISESEKIVLICELKSFLDPAETREVIQKTKEIVKGIRQIEILIEYFDSAKATIDDKLNITSDYNFMFIVISENFIGLSSVHVKEIPVISRSHIIHKIKEEESLKNVVAWLKEKKYLPIEGIHFKTATGQYKVGEWSIQNKGYVSLIRKSLIYLT